jgi:ribosomal protein S5
MSAASQSSEISKMNDESIEQEVQTKAPSVTPDDIEANIVDVEIVTHVSKAGQVLRWAVLTTRNGFAVVGKPSCAVSSANDNAKTGIKVALENSKEELWPLMGYALKEKLASDAK